MVIILSLLKSIIVDSRKRTKLFVRVVDFSDKMKRYVGLVSFHDTLHGTLWWANCCFTSQKLHCVLGIDELPNSHMNHVCADHKSMQRYQ